MLGKTKRQTTKLEIMKSDKKVLEYAQKVMFAVSEMIQDESHEYHIDLTSDSSDATAFIYALSTVAPNLLYNRLTGDEKTNLQFNHIQNQLCFQYSNFVADDE